MNSDDDAIRVLHVDDDAIRVLHVDDDPGFAELTVDALENEDDGFEVETVRHASDGLARLEETTYDCIVSDYQMPGRNGIEFLDAVREEYPDVPFVLFTGKGSEEVASEAISAGATDYLQKRGGTEQYELLANRVRNAVEQYRATRRAAELDRIRTLGSDINQALVRATSREEIERRICEIVSDSDPYMFAWIGEVDADTNRIVPRFSAGVEDDYLEEITVTADETATGRGPAGTALRERRVAVSQNVYEDPDFQRWREAALERGYRAVAAVPLSYRETLYGVLVVYADRANAFDEDERRLLAELGGDIGHAFHSLDIRAKLREEREFVDQALDALEDVFYVADPDGNLRQWNDRLSEVTGYDDDEITAMQVRDIFPADERDRIDDAVEAGFTAENVVEADLVTADGERVPYEFIGSRLTDSEGSLSGFIGIGRDVSDRRERQAQLRARATAMEASIDGMAILDAEEEYVFVNQAHADVYGYDDPDAFVGETWRMCYGEDERARIERAVKPAVFETGSWRGQAVGTRRDGTTFPQDLSLTRLDGGGMICVVRDVTDRKRREDALRELHETTRDFMEATDEQAVADRAVETAREVLDRSMHCLWLYDADDDVLRPAAVTDAAEDVVEEVPTYSGGESLSWRAFRTGSVGVYDDVHEAPERLNPETPIRSEIIVPLGEHGVLNVGATEPDAFTDVDVSLARLLGNTIEVALDSADRERRLRTHRERLQRKNERLDQFTSVVSHDLRTPLQVAHSRLELARSERDGDDEHLDAVADALDRMEGLLDSLLSLAREGPDVEHAEPVALAEVARECWRNVETGEATLVVETDRTIRAEPSRLRQVLENLVDNSVEHGSTNNRTESDGAAARTDVTITVGDREDGFYVADDGPGIPEDEREQVFESGYSTAETGHGLGLNIVAQVADAHGWDVTVTDSEDGGARFDVTGVDVVANRSQ
ncbi:MAG: GAF domain-containing protein [Haloarculaceae archaeon]